MSIRCISWTGMRRLTRILFSFWWPHSGPRRARRACEGVARGFGVPASDRAGVWGGALHWMVVAVAISAPLSAQSAPEGPQSPAPADSIEADPIRCWWRTSAGAVRVGESFTLVLTCAVLENEMTTVVPDQSRLEPVAMQLPPFEVIGGQRGPDLRSAQRRFFQYQYTLRLISTDLFGKDARIPSVQVSYYVQSRVQGGESVRGRDRTYLLPTESVRVLSLVPSEATDIRDNPAWTFSDIEALRFRARVLSVAAGLLFAAAALVVLVALVRLARQYREGGAVGRRLLSDSAILRGVRRELASVRRHSEREGWSHDLVGRALAALRIAATIALGRRPGQIASSASAGTHEGQLMMRGGWLRGKKILVSGSATTDAVGRELSTEEGNLGHRQALEAIQTGLSSLTAAQFGRDGKLDEPALAEVLNASGPALRRLRFEHLWIVRKLKGMTQVAVELGNRAWSR
jgi:hypothetical protein